jgi:L-threonate 2-dehydrogenase
VTAVAQPTKLGVIGVIGVIGVGAMGLAMALRLRDQGYGVMVCDIDASRTALAAAAGCTVVATPAAMAQACSHVVVAVVDALQMQQVLFGGDGASGVTAAVPATGLTVLLCPTVAPQAVHSAAQQLRALGVQVLDAPMSGGPQRAREGSMSLMVAGAEATYRASLPLLQTLASRLFFISTQPGDGARTKLVNNLLATVNLAGAAEALALALRLGLHGPTTLAVMAQSSGQSWIASDRMARALAADATVLARVALLAKDSALALACVGPVGNLDRAQALTVSPALALPVSEAAARVFAQAVAHGWQDHDDSVLLLLQQQQPQR